MRLAPMALPRIADQPVDFGSAGVFSFVSAVLVVVVDVVVDDASSGLSDPEEATCSFPATAPETYSSRNARLYSAYLHSPKKPSVPMLKDSTGGTRDSAAKRDDACRIVPSPPKVETRSTLSARADKVLAPVCDCGLDRNCNFDCDCNCDSDSSPDPDLTSRVVVAMVAVVAAASPTELNTSPPLSPPLYTGNGSEPCSSSAVACSRTIAISGYVEWMYLAYSVSAAVVAAEPAFFVSRTLRGGWGHLRERRLLCFVSVGAEKAFVNRQISSFKFQAVKVGLDDRKLAVTRTEVL